MCACSTSQSGRCAATASAKRRRRSFAAFERAPWSTISRPRRCRDFKIASYQYGARTTRSPRGWTRQARRSVGSMRLRCLTRASRSLSGSRCSAPETISSPQRAQAPFSPHALAIGRPAERVASSSVACPASTSKTSREGRNRIRQAMERQSRRPGVARFPVGAKSDSLRIGSIRTRRTRRRSGVAPRVPRPVGWVTLRPCPRRLSS